MPQVDTNNHKPKLDFAPIAKFIVSTSPPEVVRKSPGRPGAPQLKKTTKLKKSTD
jgi:hypothetical protein